MFFVLTRGKGYQDIMRMDGHIGGPSCSYEQTEGGLIQVAPLKCGDSVAYQAKPPIHGMMGEHGLFLDHFRGENEFCLAFPHKLLSGLTVTTIVEHCEEENPVADFRRNLKPTQLTHGL